MKTNRQTAAATKGTGAFTLVEAIVAVAILGMVAFMVFRSLLSVMDATQIGANAADHIQRERVAIKTVEDGLRGMVYYEQNQGMYALEVGPDPELPSFSFVSRVPPDYIGTREFSGQSLRRLEFRVDYVDDNKVLILDQYHVMLPPDGEESEPVVRSVLAPDLSDLNVFFWSTSVENWIDNWESTNSLPKRVKVEMALTRLDGGGLQNSDILKREIVIHSVSITKNNQNPDIPAGSTSRGSRGSRGSGGSSRGSSQSNRPKYTPEQIAAWRKRQAERSGRDGSDGRSRYTDKQRADYAKRVAEMYKRNQGSTPVRVTSSSKSGSNNSGSGNSTPPVNQPSASAGTPGASTINSALMDYEGLNGQPAGSVQQLVDEGYLDSIPAAPAGMQWAINYQGNVSLIAQ